MLEQGNLNQSIAAAKSALPNIIKEDSSAQAAFALATGAYAEAQGQLTLALNQQDHAEDQLEAAQLALVPTGSSGMFTSDDKPFSDLAFYRGNDDFSDGSGFISTIDGRKEYGNKGFWSRVLPEQSGGVPEPATWAMMLFGFGAIGAFLRRRRTTAVGV